MKAPLSKLIRRLISTMVVGGPLWMAVAACGVDDEWLKALPARIDKERQEWRIPGMAVAIVKDDQVVFARGFGVREEGKPGAVDEHTVFAIASNTKAFTATALGLLVNEKKAGWEDAVEKLLPGFALYDPYVTRELTLRDLLTHRIGFATWEGDLVWYGSTLSQSEVIANLRHQKPSSSFRSRYGYCNLTFIVAGQVIEQLSGKPWADYLSSRLLHPLGMTRTYTSVAQLAPVANVAAPHNLVNGAMKALPYRNLDNCAGAGALNASVLDLTRWLRMQLGKGRLEGKTIVPEAVIMETRKPQMTVPLRADSGQMFSSQHFMAYGLGWFLWDYLGKLVVAHSGGMDGMISRTGFVPEANLAVAILTNYERNEYNDALFYHILDHYLGAKETDWSSTYLKRFQRNEQRDRREEQRAAEQRAANSKTALPMEGFAGTYAHRTMGQAKVELRDGQPWISVDTHPGLAGKLEHWEYQTFKCSWQDPEFDASTVWFQLDEHGQPATLQFKVRDWIDPLTYIFERKK